MSDLPGGPGDNPFRGLPFFGDLARMLQGQGPVNWDAARQFAHAIATEGSPDRNVDPSERFAFAELARVAELHVGAQTGLPISTGLISIVPVTPAQWAHRTIDAYKPLFERLATALRPPDDEPDATDDPMLAMLAPMMAMLSPALIGMAAGSMVGHLARRSFGQYDLPIPRPPSDEILIVPSTLDAFGSEWGLPRDDLRLWLCLHELTHHAVLNVPHIRAELTDLISSYVAAFRPQPDALAQRFESLETSDDMDMAGLQQGIQQLLGDPEVLLGAISTPEQQALLPRLQGLLAVVIGYVDHVLDEVGHRLLPNYAMLAEALRRNRVEASPSDRYVERLFGLHLDRHGVERGARFVSGVLERAGEAGLSRLWQSRRELPTPAEVDAPGLWLERIDLPD